MIKRIIAITATVIFIFTAGGSQNERRQNDFVELRDEQIGEAETGEAERREVAERPDVSGRGVGQGVDTVGGMLEHKNEVADAGSADTGEVLSESYVTETNGAGDEEGYLDGAEGSQQESESDTGEVELTYLGDWTITGYCPCSECNGVWADGRTAYGEIPTAGHTIACNILPAYTQVMINGTVYTVEDTGFTPYGDEWIDIFFETHEIALEWGVKVLPVYLLG